MVHSVGNRSSESARIRSIYESEYPVSASRAWSAAWSPRNPTAVYFRQSVELALVRALNEARLDLRDLFSDFEVIAVQPMFHRWTEMLAARAPDLATALERLPLPKSNLLAVLRAPA